MGSREHILRKLKDSTKSTKKLSNVIPIKSPQKGDINLFQEKATLAGANVTLVYSMDEVWQKVKSIINENNYNSIILSADNLVKNSGIYQNAVSKGLECYEAKRDAYREKVFKIDLGITGANYAVANTGSVVIFHSDINERLISLAPNHHICIVSSTTLLDDRFSLAAILNSEQDKYKAITIITGVSRTADVALQVVLGMHGPRKVDIIIMED